jgi:1,4-dihydroxy-2-naphthoyl-CoA hydrolase
VEPEDFDHADLTQLLNDRNAGFTKAMDFRYLTVTADEVVIEWVVAEHHLQPFGIVHGGVHAGAIETACSIGAGFAARKRGHTGGVVGLENHTSFLKAVRAGIKLRVRAVPVTRGRTTHVWSAEIHDDSGRLIANGSVRLLVVSQDQLPQP